MTLVLAVVFDAHAQSTRPSLKYDWSTPEAADRSLWLASGEYDVAGVMRVYHATSDDERALRDAFGDLVAASGELNRACLARFKRGLPRDTADPAKRKTLVEIQGDTAIMYLGEKTSGLQTRWVRVNGEWKLPMDDVLDAHLRIDKTVSKALRNKLDWNGQIRRMADKVRAGRYSSPEEVDEALGDLAAGSEN